MPISAQLFEYDFFRHLHIYCQVILPCLHLRLFWRAKNIAEKMDTNAQWFHSSWSILPQRVNIRVRGFHLVFYSSLFCDLLFVADWDSHLNEQNHLVLSLRTSMSSILVLHILHVQPRNVRWVWPFCWFEFIQEIRALINTIPSENLRTAIALATQKMYCYKCYKGNLKITVHLYCVIPPKMGTLMTTVQRNNHMLLNKLKNTSLRCQFSVRF